MNVTTIKSPILLLAALLLILGGSSNVLAHGGQGFQVPAFPRAAQRGHIRIRNGIFGSSYHEKWGNGLTQYGAAVITNVASNAATVATQYFALGQTPMVGAIVPSAATGAGGANDTVGSGESAEADAQNERDPALDSQRDENLNKATESTRNAFEMLEIAWSDFTPAATSGGSSFQIGGTVSNTPGAGTVVGPNINKDGSTGPQGGTDGKSSRGSLPR